MKMLIEKSEKQSSHMRTSKTGKIYSAGSGVKQDKDKLTKGFFVKTYVKEIKDYKSFLQKLKNKNIKTPVNSILYGAEDFANEKGIEIDQSEIEKTIINICKKLGVECDFDYDERHWDENLINKFTESKNK